MDKSCKSQRFFSWRHLQQTARMSMSKHLLDEQFFKETSSWQKMYKMYSTLPFSRALIKELRVIALIFVQYAIIWGVLLLLFPCAMLPQFDLLEYKKSFS